MNDSGRSKRCAKPGGMFSSIGRGDSHCRRNVPNGMNPLLRVGRIAYILEESPHSGPRLDRTSFEPLGVMEYEARSRGERNFIPNIVGTSLGTKHEDGCIKNTAIIRTSSPSGDLI